MSGRAILGSTAEFSTAGLSAALSGLASAAAFASLHTADPSGSGGSEVVGGSYSRVAVAFGTPVVSAVADLAVTALL